MNFIGSRAACVAAGIVWAIVAGVPAAADDTEIFFVDPDNIENKPNILFILDNSTSMLATVESQSPYVPSTVYDNVGCAGRVYWATGSNPPVPTCDDNRWFNRTSFTCKAGLDQFAAGAERFRDYMAQYNPNTSGTNPQRWLTVNESQKTRFVECQDDNGVHGQTDASTLRRPRNGTTTGWSTSTSVSWPSSQVTVFDGNYLNWYHGPTGPEPKIDVVKSVATNLLNSIADVNVGVMFFNYDEGGYVAHALEDVATAREEITAKINAVSPGAPASTYTPLSETLYEAAQYFMGRAVDYGDVGLYPSVPESRVGNAYLSPLEAGCQKNFIVLLSDGAPTQDTGANGKITALPGWSDAVGSAGCDGSGDGRCLDDLAQYLYEADLSDLDADQNVITYTVGFDIDLPLLATTAQRGGGAYFTANDSGSLSTALTSIIYDILNTSSTFSAPAVSINSFNRTRNLNDLFISVFTATSTTHWPGNLKKYRLRPSDSEIVDANNVPAVDATGFFAEGTQSYWSATPDGPAVTAGGAANRIPLPASRRVYTHLSGADLTASGNQIVAGNALLDDALLGTGTAGRPTRAQVIDFMRGTRPGGTEPRYQMGDPLHSQPASVTYTADRTLIFFATNDGYLHAIDTETGTEQWAFIPPEFLNDQAELYMNEQVADTRHYGIDGNLRLQLVADGNGIIESGEKVYLFFGMRRGGDFYYGLDVSNPDAPRLLWRLGSAQLPGIGQSWASPVPAKVQIGGTTRLVLILGGGYDTRHDDYNLLGTDTVGNAIYIVDSETGALLWHGSKDGTHADFARMDYAIPADIKAIDLNADGLVDRMYASDMGGQVWRFDIRNGQSAANLVTGGVIAQLGGAPLPSPAIAETRRFYYSPDVALVNADPSFVHVGIGSGHRARPNSVFNQDRFYALRDYRTFSPMTQAEYEALTPIVDGDLVDITNDVDAQLAANSSGWKLRLGGIGEKALAEARTFNNEVYFTTFTPGAGAGGNTTNCRPALGMNRLYVVSLFNGAPVNNMDRSVDEDGEEDEDLTESDRYMEFPGSIASEVVFIFPSPDDEQNCVGDECTPPPVACVDLFCFPPGFANDPVRTFWRQESIE